jgi:predicted glycoside hydrolase/deacetylase ChbG (UPF0249 family)
MMGKIKLIVNADDFGQSEGINKGIIQSYEKGILTSASLMVRYSSTTVYAAEYAKKNNLALGLHLDLGEWIYNNENWNPIYEVISLDDISAVTEEIKNQLHVFYNLVGRNPTHIDSHQHVHKRKSILPIILDIARDLNVTLRGCTKKVNYCGDFYGQTSDSSPYHEAISAQNLKKIISTLPVGITEVACHPGINVEIATMYKIERDIEVNSLCDKDVRETIFNSDIELCSFSDIPF